MTRFTIDITHTDGTHQQLNIEGRLVRSTPAQYRDFRGLGRTCVQAECLWIALDPTIEPLPTSRRQAELVVVAWGNRRLRLKDAALSVDGTAGCIQIAGEPT